MREEIKGACLIAFFAAIRMLMSVIPVAMAIPGKLWLETVPPGTYVDDSEDAWFIESYVTNDTKFDLTIFYHHGADIHYLYLLVAVDTNPEGNVNVYVNGEIVDNSYDGVITNNNNALIKETDPYWEYPGHGIYKCGSSTHFAVVNITDQIPGDGKLEIGETITVPVEIEPIASEVRVHFDAVGADSSMKAIAFVPPSHDVTQQVPEFATIAIPIASILGLLFFFNHRKRRKEE